MLTLKKITRPIALLIPLIVLTSGCKAISGHALLSSESVESVDFEKPDGLRKSVSMSVGDQGFASASIPVENHLRSAADNKSGNQKRSQFLQPLKLRKLLNRPNVNELLNSARQLELAGRFPESIQKFDWLVQNGHASVLALHRLGVLYDKTGRSDLSGAYYQRAVKKDPTNPELLCDIGYRSSVNGDFESAKKFFELALAYSPNFDRAHNNLAEVFARTNRPDLALDHFRQAGCTQLEAQHNFSLITSGSVALSPKRQMVATTQASNVQSRVR